MNTEHALIELAHEGIVASDLRERVLALICPELDADLGLFIALEDGREERSLRGLPPSAVAQLDGAWSSLRRDAKPMVGQALLHGATTDRNVLGSSLERTTLFRRLMAPVGGTETLFLVPRLGDRPLGMMALGRCGGSFSAAALAHAKDLVPAISVVYRAVASSTVPLSHLTSTEIDLLDYLELGFGTRQIAEVRGTSFFTVRNQLSSLYRKLEVTNRAEAVGIRRRAGKRGP